MIALLQRVARAEVAVEGEVVAAIGPGLCVFVGVERDDGPAQAERMAERLLAYRVFADAAGHMNRSVLDVDGELLLVPNFTLAADTRKGTRPSFSPAAAPDHARHLFSLLLGALQRRHARVRQGRFGAHMRVGLVNDGPVTVTLKA